MWALISFSLQVANESDAIVLKFGLTLQQIMDVVSLLLFMSQLLLLGKFEYGGGPIFKVVLEC